MTQPPSLQQAKPLSEAAAEVQGSAATATSSQAQRVSSESSDGTPKQALEVVKKDTEDNKEEGDDNAESSSTASSSQEGQGSGEGYTADCSSDTSSDLSGSAKKKGKDNMIVSVNNLSLEDSTNDGTEAQTEKDENSSSSRAEGHKKGGKLKAPPSSKAAKDSKHSKKHHHHHKKHHKKKKRPSVAESADNPALDGTEGDCSTTDDPEQQQHRRYRGRKLAQWNGVQVVHPMDPRIDISKVGYMPQSPGIGRKSVDGESKQGDAPSLEHYVELMEVVRPFFSTYGFGEETSSTRATAQGSEEGLPQGDPMASLPSSSLEAQAGSISPGAADRATSGGESGTSTSVSGTRSTSSQSSQSAARRPVDAPLHLLSRQDIAANAPKPPPVPLQLAARQKPLAAAAAAEFYAPDDDPADEDDSDTSSMVVLARTKRKHKQNSTSGASTSQGDGDNSSIRDSIDTNSVRPQHHQPAETAMAMDAGGDNDEEEEEDRKPAAKPQAPRQQEEAPRPPIQNKEPAQEDDDAGQEGSASSSSLSDQRIQAAPHPQANQPRHNNYDDAHVVTESASNTNTTTSGSGSGSGSGGNQGSSGSGNGSSGDGEEGKGSSEDVGTKEENGGASNSNSEDVNSDDRKPDDEKEIAHPAVARRHGAGTVADVGGNDQMNMDAPFAQAPSDQDDAARERKLQDKKRKRMNMRREYEEKVQQEMESSESSSTKGAILLRPGKPVTLDKVLSFTKVARMVIQAGPPFLVVHTNAAYTRLTGIDAHAAVGKPVSALLAAQPPPGSPETGAQAGGHQPTESNQLQGYIYQGDQMITNADANNGQRLGQSYAGAEEAGRVRAAQANQNDLANVNLERLVAACGFGKYHVLHARARPHHMVGRNVTFVNKAGTAIGALPPTASSSKPADNGMRKPEESNFDTSLIRNVDGPTDSLKCRSSISPIVSDNIDSAVVTDNNQEPNHKSKRRKHHHHGGTEQQGSAATLRSDGHHHHRRPYGSKDSPFMPKRFQQYVTHYAIQLEIFDDSKELNDNSSSSNSVEANLLGLTKEELHRQRQAAQGGDHGDSQEESEQLQQEPDEQDDDEMASETTEATAPVTAVG